ncbi:MAG TPA: glycosyltransferase family 4 protein [Candidatus Binatia bacterium]|jgi:UDP-glucose:(heptosyl)LPS alpha-1,3-glucosyltransferase|nr:glycosyltransferase family 4 protein [Candidatus Binatia bacterium]
MKLAIVHKRFDRVGGAERECYELSRQLAARGHDVHIVAGECRTAVPDGIHMHRVPLVRAGQTGKLLSFAARAPRVWRAIGADVVIGFGRTVGPDIFRASECHREYLDRLAVERGVFERLRQRSSVYERAILAVEARQYSRGGQRIVLAVSELMRKDLLKNYPAARPESIEVLHCGVDVERFHPGRGAEEGAGLRRELGIALEQPLVLFVGGGFRRKGVDTLIEIWRREPPAGAALVVVGGDPHLEAHARAARSMRGPVIFTGPRTDTERFYAAADLFTLPSLYEGCPVSILEALASGLPVVTSRATGAPELLSGPLAELLVDDPRDGDGLADRMRLGLDPARRRELAEAARAAGVGASLSALVDKLEAWCHKIAAERGTIAAVSQ